MGYKCEACKKNTATASNTLCLNCQAKGYFYRWGTLMKDKRIGKTKNSEKENLKKLIKGKSVWENIETGFINKHGALDF